MSARDQNRRDNDALQSSEDDLALGQDERAFGAGGQTEERAVSGNDAPDRDVQRDGTLPDGANATTSSEG